MGTAPVAARRRGWRMPAWAAPGAHPVPVDIALAAGIAVFAWLGGYFELKYAGRPVPPPIGGYLLGAGAAAVLVVRRRYPVAACAGTLLALLGYHLIGYPGGALGLAVFVVCYSLPAYGRTGASVPGALLVAVLASLVPVLPPHRVSWFNFAVSGPTMGMAWMVVLGAASRYRRLDAERRVRRAERVAEAESSQRLREERLRIARELHDVLAHTVSVIVVQSGAALDALDAPGGDPDRVREALRGVRAAAKQALPELRATLGLLRATPDGRPDLLPAPGLALLPHLAAQARATGLRVDLEVPPEAAELPPLVQLSAYRIVQEALTNVIRHADAATVRVVLRRSGEELSLDVVDDGRGSTGGSPGGSAGGSAVEPAASGHSGEPSGGLGLVGMRERASLLGGSLTAGPGTGGGFRVHARLPLERA